MFSRFDCKFYVKYNDTIPDKKKSNLNKLKSYNASPLYFLDWNSFLKSSDPFP